MPGRVVAPIVVVALALVLGARTRAVEPAVRRVVLVSLDGAADWMFDRLLAQGKAPAFAALASDGAMAEAAQSTVPSLTSVAHATIWTGAPPSVTGVSGNAVAVGPPGEHTILERLSGFESQARHAQPIWEAAARAGRRALVLQGTGAYPFPNPALERELLFDVYGARMAPAELVTGSLVAGQYILETPAGSATLSAADGGALRIALGDRSWTLAATGSAWTPPITATVSGQQGAFSIGVLDFVAATGAFMLVRGEVLRISSSDPSQVEAFRALAGTLVDEGSFVGWYQRDRLGPTLASGGTGRAEDRLVALSAAAQSYFDGAVTYASRREWDLLVCYSPVFDGFAHAMVGLVDPDSSRSSPALAERAWPYLEKAVAVTVDRFVGDLRRRFPDATIIVTSDHGMEGTGRVVFPNVILRQAGLLELDANGAVDLTRTKAVVLDQRAGLVTLNTTDRKGGIVPHADRALVKRQVVAALLSARDPETGAPVIRAVLDAETDGSALGFSPEGGADLVLDPAVDYAIQAALAGGAVAAASTSTVGEGKHGPLPTRRRLQGIFFAAGPGVRPGLRLPLVHLTDVAPTVARLLGIPPPAQATGAPLLLDPR